MTSPARYGWLPAVLAEIAEVAGLAAALAVAEKRGGTVVYMPARAEDRHWLVAAVGREAADKLCAHFRGVDVELPLGPRGSAAKTRAIVDRMIVERKSESEIALAAGYTERGVRMRKARAARLADKRQGRLL